MRGRLIALVAVVALAVVAFVHGLQGPPKTDKLASLRVQSGFPPCPTGIGPALPKLTLACLGGGAPVVLRGKPSGTPTLVNLYGSWCGPCQKEMPVLASFAKAAGGKVSLLGVDTEDDQRLALLFARDVHQTWNAVVDDDGTVLRTYASGPPVTLFVDASGAVVHVQVGAFKDEAQVRQLTQTYLKVGV